MLSASQIPQSDFNWLTDRRVKRVGNRIAQTGLDWKDILAYSDSSNGKKVYRVPAGDNVDALKTIRDEWADRLLADWDSNEQLFRAFIVSPSVDDAALHFAGLTDAIDFRWEGRADHPSKEEYLFMLDVGRANAGCVA
jgi:hypothetical protein